MPFDTYIHQSFDNQLCPSPSNVLDLANIKNALKYVLNIPNSSSLNNSNQTSSSNNNNQNNYNNNNAINNHLLYIKNNVSPPLQILNYPTEQWTVPVKALEEKWGNRIKKRMEEQEKIQQQLQQQQQNNNNNNNQNNTIVRSPSLPVFPFSEQNLHHTVLYSYGTIPLIVNKKDNKNDEKEEKKSIQVLLNIFTAFSLSYEKKKNVFPSLLQKVEDAEFTTLNNSNNNSTNNNNAQQTAFESLLILQNDNNKKNNKNKKGEEENDSDDTDNNNNNHNNNKNKKTQIGLIEEKRFLHVMDVIQLEVLFEKLNWKLICNLRLLPINNFNRELRNANNNNNENNETNKSGLKKYDRDNNNNNNNNNKNNVKKNKSMYVPFLYEVLFLTPRTETSIQVDESVIRYSNFVYLYKNNNNNNITNNNNEEKEEKQNDNNTNTTNNNIENNNLTLEKDREAYIASVKEKGERMVEEIKNEKERQLKKEQEKQSKKKETETKATTTTNNNNKDNNNKTENNKANENFTTNDNDNKQQQQPQQPQQQQEDASNNNNNNLINIIPKWYTLQELKVGCGMAVKNDFATGVNLYWGMALRCGSGVCISSHIDVLRRLCCNTHYTAYHYYFSKKQQQHKDNKDNNKFVMHKIKKWECSTRLCVNLITFHQTTFDFGAKWTPFYFYHQQQQQKENEKLKTTTTTTTATSTATKNNNSNNDVHHTLSFPQVLLKNTTLNFSHSFSSKYHRGTSFGVEIENISEGLLSLWKSRLQQQQQSQLQTQPLQETNNNNNNQNNNNNNNNKNNNNNGWISFDWVKTSYHVSHNFVTSWFTSSPATNNNNNQNNNQNHQNNNNNNNNNIVSVLQKQQQFSKLYNYWQQASRKTKERYVKTQQIVQNGYQTIKNGNYVQTILESATYDIAFGVSTNYFNHNNNNNNGDGNTVKTNNNYNNKMKYGGLQTYFIITAK